MYAEMRLVRLHCTASEVKLAFRLSIEFGWSRNGITWCYKYRCTGLKKASEEGESLLSKGDASSSPETFVIIVIRTMLIAPVPNTKGWRWQETIITTAKKGFPSKRQYTGVLLSSSYRLYRSIEDEETLFFRKDYISISGIRLPIWKDSLSTRWRNSLIWTPKDFARRSYTWGANRITWQIVQTANWT